ncbi:MAG: nucleotidyltransferase domain-containing protein [Alcaligenaceae bacterium]|nr:nucleotidyltransferase domain-containing protein [Alcaligenaceae bacterium]
MGNRKLIIGMNKRRLQTKKNQKTLTRDALQPLAAQIIAAFVYGSVAKKTDTANSDITVLANKIGGGVEAKTVLNMASEHSHNNENLSRAKFCVPITLPCTILEK